MRARDRLRRSIEKTAPDWLALLGGRLPRFVYGGPLDALAVFTYHRVGPELEEDLRYLREAGYRTLGAEEIAQLAARRAPLDPRAVALSFDDGDASVTEIAAPLLAKFGHRALAFVVPGHVPEFTQRGLAGWRELRRAAADGVLEVGSHSLYHHCVPVSPEVIGFVSPQTPLEFHSAHSIWRCGGAELPQPGTPILRSRPRYAVHRAFIPDPASIERCCAIARHSGPGFFLREGWERSLRRAMPPLRGAYETPSQADAAIAADMRRSLQILEARCPNPAARHLCYPWYAGDARTDRLALAAGASVLYKGVLARSRAPGADRPAALQRLPSDLLRRLPSPERSSLSHIVRMRLDALLHHSS